MRYWVEETYHLECSRTEAQRLFDSFPTWAGTNHVAESVDDLDMGLSLGEDGIHEISFSCSVDAVHMNDHFPTLDFAKPTLDTRVLGVGEAAMDAHNVVTAFMALHDVGTWRVHDGHTHLTSSEDGDDTEHPYLTMTVHHGEKDLSMLYAVPDPEFWFSHHRE